MVGYQAGMNDQDEFSENLSLSKLQRYASEFGLDKKTGIELSEERLTFLTSMPFLPISDREIICTVQASSRAMQRLWPPPEQYTICLFWTE